MKRFIDENGTFEVRVPTTWKYSLQNEKVHTFQEYEIWKPDAFQISIQESNGEAQLRFQTLTKNLTSTEISGIKYYNFPESGDEGFITKSWTTFIEDRIGGT